MLPTVRQILPSRQEMPRVPVNAVRTTLLIAGGSVATYYAVRGIIRLVKGPVEKSEQKEVRSELETLNKSPKTKQTLPQSQIESMANSLHTAADGYGTNSKYIYNSFRRLKNNADYLALSKAYGIREVSSGTWNPEKNYVGNLSGMLVSELDEDELAKVNAILKSKGIKYRV